MARKTFTKNSEEWNFFRDYYQLVQEYAVIDKAGTENDVYWESLLSTTNELYAEYNNCPFFLSLLTAFVNEKEREQQEMNANAKETFPTTPTNANVCMFGPEKGKTLEELSDKMLAWMLASMETGQNLEDFIPDPEYITSVKELVEKSSNSCAIYKTFMQKRKTV